MFYRMFPGGKEGRLMKKITNTAGAFIIPFRGTGLIRELDWLDSALKSIESQTDDNWIVFVIDDKTLCEKSVYFLAEKEKQFSGKLKLLRMCENKGPGVARNIGIAEAAKYGCPIVMYLDADDVAHPRRLEVVRDLIIRRNVADVLYSTFEIIDEYGERVPENSVTPSILEILETHSASPPEGKDFWIQMAVETGYVNLTSSTSVRTEIALGNPFPEERISEDFYTWMTYSASGAVYGYTPEVPSKYRIPQACSGSTSREREGGIGNFNREKCRIDIEGFEKSAEIALNHGTISRRELSEIRRKFLLRRAKSMELDGEYDLAEKLRFDAVLS